MQLNLGDPGIGTFTIDVPRDLRAKFISAATELRPSSSRRTAHIPR